MHAPRATLAYTAAGWLDTVMIAALSTVLYVLLGQDAIHGDDVYYLVTFLEQDVEHGAHLLYLHVVDTFRRTAGAALGLNTFEAMRLCSALSTALGVAAMHRAARALEPGRVRALGVAGLCAVAPAVVFFATVVEIPGVAFGCTGLAWWCAARLARRPRVLLAVMLGGATGLSASVHAPGHLLPGLMLLVSASLFADDSQVGIRRFTVLAAVTAVAHGATALLLSAVVQPGAFGEQLAFFSLFLKRDHPLWLLPVTLWREWLWPFVPVAWVTCVAWIPRPTRALAAATWVGTLGYLVIAFVMLTRAPERGAYFLPVVFPAALLTVRLLPRPAWIAAVIVSLAIAVWEVERHDRPRGDGALVADLRAIAARDQVLVVCSGKGEVHPLLRTAPEVFCIGLHTIVQQTIDYELLCQSFDSSMAQLERDGRVVLLTGAAHRRLAESADPVFGRFFDEYLPVRYALTPVREGRFEGVRLEPRR